MKLLRSVKFITTLGLVLIIILALAAFRYANSFVPVQEVKVESVQVARTISGSGEVKSLSQADLSFSSIGEITRMNATEGQKVKEGEVLAQIDIYTILKEAQAAKDDRDVALRDKELFLAQYQNNKGGAGGSDQYNIKLRQLDERISKAEANYQAQLGKITKNTLNAPFEGTIVDIIKKQGETAAAGETIIKVANLDKLIFEIDIDQEDFGLIKPGQSAQITLDSYDNKEFKGKVVELPLYSKKDASGSQMFVVKLEIEKDENSPVLMGMTGDANITISQTQQEISALPFDYINSDKEGSFVWVLQNGLVKKEYIKTGLEGDIYVELLTVPQSKIIVPQNEKIELKEGMKAKIAGLAE